MTVHFTSIAIMQLIIIFPQCINCYRTVRKGSDFRNIQFEGKKLKPFALDANYQLFLLSIE